MSYFFVPVVTELSVLELELVALLVFVSELLIPPVLPPEVNASEFLSDVAAPSVFSGVAAVLVLLTVVVPVDFSEAIALEVVCGVAVLVVFSAVGVTAALFTAVVPTVLSGVAALLVLFVELVLLFFGLDRELASLV